MESPDELSTPPQPRQAEEEEEEDEDDVDEDNEDDDEEDDGPEVQEEDEEVEEQQQDDGDNVGGESCTIIRATQNLDEMVGLREIGHEAVCWSLSSAKPGNGVEQIRDSSHDTYWQSDGSQPHYIQISFSRRVAISHVCMYLDFNLDESYTPKKVSVEVRMTTQDLQGAVFPSVELHEPVGWCIVPLRAPPDPLDDDDENDDGSPPRLLKAHLVQIAILSMHQNGRDTHIRQVKLFGPRREGMGGVAYQSKASSEHVMPRGIPPFSTVQMSQYSEIR